MTRQYPHTDPVERFTQCGWRGEIGLSAADLPGYLWHLLQQVNSHPVGRIEINPQKWREQAHNRRIRRLLPERRIRFHRQ